MKKFLKVFIIVLLVLGAVVGTTFIFFINYEKENNTTESICELLQSEKKMGFNDALQTTSDIVDSDGTDKRMNLIVETNKMLDEIVFDLSAYHIQAQTKIKDKALTKSLNQLNKSRTLLTNMLEEFNIKKDSAFYDRHLGLNDLYQQSCVYLSNYASFANSLNKITDVEKSSDIKFTTFEIYANVVKKAFSNINRESSIVVIDDSHDINILNDVMEIQLNTGSVQNMENLFSSYANNFINYYNKCNKELFVKDLKFNLEVSNTVNPASNEKTATYYFKTIYGI